MSRKLQFHLSTMIAITVICALMLYLNFRPKSEFFMGRITVYGWPHSFLAYSENSNEWLFLRAYISSRSDNEWDNWRNARGFIIYPICNLVVSVLILSITAYVLERFTHTCGSNPQEDA